MVTSRPNIVGRESEIDSLETALESAKSGNGRTIGLFGEPGIGKTSLVSTTIESAETRGFKVIKGYCREHGGAPAYWPWIELIRGLLSGKTDQEAKQILGENVGWLAEISPDAARFVPAETPGRPTASPEEFRFQLFDSLSRTLQSAAAIEPMLLIIEDIHWADESSLYLLELLASSTGDSAIAIVFTSRDADMADNPTALTRSIGELMRWDVFSKIDLAPLSLEATAEQVESLGGDGANDALRDAIYASSEGNPLFTAELIRLLAQEGRLKTATADDIGVTGGVSEVISRRLSDLDESELGLLQSCSVIGQRTEIELLAKVSELPPYELLAGLAGPISSQIMQLDGSNLNFTHALIGEAVLAGISVTDLVNHNAKIAESLLEFSHGNSRPYLQRLANHYVAAQAITGVDPAVEFSLLAGEEALRISEFSSGRRHFDRVLELTANTEINDNRAQALAGVWMIGSRTAHEHEIVQLVQLLRESFDYFVSNGDTKRAIDLAGWAATPYSSPRGLDDIVARALELTPRDSLDAGRLLAKKSITAYMEHGALEEARDNFDQAVTIARKYNDRDLELVAHAAMLSTYGHSEIGITDENLVLRGIELANNASDPFYESVFLFRAIAWYITSDDKKSARRHMIRAREVDDIIRSPNRKVTNLALESSLDRNEGLWSNALNLCKAALEIDESDPRPMSVTMRVENETGEFDSAEAYLDRLMAIDYTVLGTHPYTSSFQALSLAWNFEITGNESHLARAKAISETIIKAGAPTGSAERHHRAALLNVATYTNDVELASANFPLLRKMGYGGDVDMGFDRTLARGAALLGKLDEAELIYDEVLASRRKAGYYAELAWTCFDYSTFLFDRNSDGDADKANKLVAEALEITNRLGMPPLQAKLEELAVAGANNIGKGTRGLPAGLSPREVEVLKLVATGMTNGRIADELFISTNTVIRHMSNIMSKTKTASRTEAGLFAERNGLL